MTHYRIFLSASGVVRDRPGIYRVGVTIHISSDQEPRTEGLPEYAGDVGVVGDAYQRVRTSRIPSGIIISLVAAWETWDIE